MKKIVSLLMSILFVLNIFVIDVAAITDNSVASTAASGNYCGTNVTWSYSGSTLTISGTGDMTDYSYFDQAPWKSYNIKNIVINSGVTSIGNYAFYFLSNLTSVSIPDTVTRIGEDAFEHCDSLTRIVIPQSVTEIGDSCFWGCDNLSQVNIPQGVTVIEDMAFGFCDNLKSIALPDSIVTIGSSAFMNSGISSIVLPDSVETIEWQVFSDCENLTSLHIPANVNYIGEGFLSGCNALSYITVDENNVYYDSRNYCNAIIDTYTDTLVAGCANTVIPADVVEIGMSAFCGVSSLTNITIPASVKRISGNAFSGCNTLASVTLSEGLESIGNSAFSCTSIANIEFPSTLTSIEYGAFQSSALTSVTIPKNITVIEDSVFNYCYNLASLKFHDGITHIGSWAFADCSLLTGDLVIPDSVTTIDHGAFEYCYSLNGTLTLPENLTTIGSYAFSGCSGITGELIIPDKVTTIGYDAFANMENITSITIGENVTVLGNRYESDDVPFYGMTSVEKVTFRGTTVPKIQYGDTTYNHNQFVSMSNLEKVYVPASAYDAYYAAYKDHLGKATLIGYEATEDGFVIENGVLIQYNGTDKNIVIPDNVKVISENLFRNNAHITSVTLNSNLERIESGAFYGCTSLEKVDFNDNLTYIGNDAFYQCSSLSGVLNMPSSLKTIASRAFGDCVNISGVLLNDGLTTLGESAFYGCSALSGELEIPCSVTVIEKNAFALCNNISGLKLNEGLTKISDGAFESCYDLSGQLIIPSTVTAIGSRAFYNCTNITGELVIPDNVIQIGNSAFSGLDKVNKIIIGVNVTTLGDKNSLEQLPFYGMSNVTQVVFKGVNVPVINASGSICNNNQFVSMTNLLAVYVPGDALSDYQTAYGGYIDSDKIIPLEGDQYFFNIVDGVLVSYNGKSDEVVIPDDVTAIGDNAFAYNEKIKTVVLSENITSIGVSAFKGCTSLESVKFNDNLTTIKDYAFCESGLSGDLVIPQSVKEIGDGAFAYCGNLDAKVVIEGNADGTTIGEIAFLSCVNIESLELQDGVTTIKLDAFRECSNLSGALEFPNSVTSIGVGAFDDCYKLTKVVFNEGLTSIGDGAFDDCYALQEIKFNNGLLSIGSWAFSSCQGVTGELVIPDSVVSVGSHAFNEMTGVTSIVLGSNVKYLSDSSYYYSPFAGMSSLKKVYFKGLSVPMPKNSTAVFNYFDGLTQLEEVYVPVAAYDDYSQAFCKYLPDSRLLIIDPDNEDGFITDGDTLVLYQGSAKNVVIPEGIKAIGNSAFQNCKTITSVTFNDELTSVGNYAFNGCTNLESITFNENLESIGDYAFCRCSNVTSQLILPDTLSHLGFNAFSGMTNVTDIVVGKNIKELNHESSDYSPFYGLTGVKTITFLSDTPISVTYGDGYTINAFEPLVSLETIYVTTQAYQAFVEKHNTKVENARILLIDSECDNDFVIDNGTLVLYQGNDSTVIIPDEITSIGNAAFKNHKTLTQVAINEQCTTIGQYAFYGCSALENISFNKNVTTISVSAFENCTALTNLYFNSGLTYIYNNAFRGCTGLSGDLNIPSSVSFIGDEAFVGCTGINGKLTIEGNGSTYIGTHAFGSCTGISAIELKEGIAAINAGAFYNCSGIKGDLILPDSLQFLSSYAFASCSGLDGTLKLPNGLKTIDRNVFDGCSGLSGELVIPSSVQTINNNAFLNMSNITSIVVGENVTTLGTSLSDSALPFYGMSGVETITFKGKTVPKAYYNSEHKDANQFASMSKLKAVYVPAVAYSDYVSAFDSYIDPSIISYNTLELGVENLKVVASYNNTIKLSWAKHVDDSIEEYVILRGSQEIARTYDCSYVDTNLEPGSYVYSVYGLTSDNEQTAMTTCNASTSIPEPVDIYTSFSKNRIGINGSQVFITAKNNLNYCDLDSNELKGKLYYINADNERVFMGESVLSTASVATDTLLYTVNCDINKLADGEYSVVFVIEDIDGAVGEYGETITVDTSVPEKIINTVAVGDFDKIHLSWSQSSEVDSSTYKIYRKAETDQEYSLIKTITNRSTVTYTDTSCVKGIKYYYYVISVNSMGMESAPSNIAVAIRETDTEPPTVTKFTPASYSYISKIKTITVTAVDNLMVKSAKLYYSLDEGENWTFIAEDTSVPYNFTFDSTPFADGVITMKAVAYDAEGNESATKTAVYSIDNTGPQKVTGLSAKAILASKITLEWDDVTDNDIACFILQQKTASGYTTISSNITVLGYNLSGLLANTSYTYRVAGVDVYGNVGEYSDDFTVTTSDDVTAPVVTSLSPNPGRYNSTIPFKASAGDDSGIKSITIQTSTDKTNWKDVSVATYTTYKKTATYSYNLSLSNYNDGSIYVRAVATDFSGNLSDSSASAPYVEYMVDKTAPDKPRDIIASGGDGWIYISWVQGIESDLNTYSLYRSTSPDSGYSLLASGLKKLNYYDNTAHRNTLYYYKIRVTDTTGNTSDYSEVASAMVADDVLAPEIVSIAPTNNSYVGPSYKTVEALVKDNNCLDSIVMQYKINDETKFKTLKEYNSVNSYYITTRADLPVNELEDQDKIYVRVYATDITGLVSEYSYVYTYVVDKVAPAIHNLSTVVENDNSKITWNDDSATDISGYKIYRVNNNGTFKYLGSRSYSSNHAYTFYDYLYNLGSGDYAYKIEAYDKVGNTNTYLTDPVHYEFQRVNASPVAVITANEVMEIGVEEYFDAGKSADDVSIVSYLWDFGDGTTSTEIKPVKKYTAVGTYTVTLTVTDSDGATDSKTMKVSVSERTAVGTVRVNVVDENGTAVSNAPVYYDLGTNSQKIMYTNSKGVASLLMANGDHDIGVYKSGYLPVQKKVTVLPNATRTITLTIIKQEIVTGSFEVTRMTLNEIKAAGIEEYDPANQNVYKVSVQLKFGNSTVPVSYIRNDSKIISYSIGNTGGSSTTTQKPVITVSDSGVSRRIDSVTFIPNNKNAEIIAVLDMPVGASYLKEFFDVKLHIVNNASEDFKLTNNEVDLNVPSGLTMMSGLDGDWNTTSKVHIDTIVGQQTKTLNWVLRGDKEGEYNLSADFEGTLDMFNETVNATFKTTEPIKVYGLSNFKMHLQVNKEIEYNAFYFNIGMENAGSVDMYNPQLDFEGIVSNITSTAMRKQLGLSEDEAAELDFEQNCVLINVKYEYADGSFRYIPFTREASKIKTHIETLAPGEKVFYEFVAYNIINYDGIAYFNSAASKVLSEYGKDIEITQMEKNLYNVNNTADKIANSTLNQDALSYITNNKNYYYWTKATHDGDKIGEYSTNIGRTLYDCGDLIFNFNWDVLTGEDREKMAEMILLQLLTSQEAQENIDDIVNEDYIGAVKTGLSFVKNNIEDKTVDIDKFCKEYAYEIFTYKYSEMMIIEEDEIVVYSELSYEYQRIIKAEYDNAKAQMQQVADIIDGFASNYGVLHKLAGHLKHEGPRTFNERLTEEVVKIAGAAGLSYINWTLKDTFADNAILNELESSCKFLTKAFSYIVMNPVKALNEANRTLAIQSILQSNACAEEMLNICDMLIEFSGYSENEKLSKVVSKVAQNYKETIKGRTTDFEAEFIKEFAKATAETVISAVAQKMVQKVLSLMGSKFVAIYALAAISFDVLDHLFQWGEKLDCQDKLGIAECMSSAFIQAWKTYQREYESKKDYEIALTASHALKYLTQTRLIGEGMFKDYIENIKTGFLENHNKTCGTSYENIEEFYDVIYSSVLYARDKLFSKKETQNIEIPAAPEVTINYNTLTTNETFTAEYEYCYADGEWKPCTGSTIPVKQKTHTTVLRVRKASHNGYPSGEITTVTIKAKRELSKNITVRYDSGKYYFTNLLDVYKYQIYPINTLDQTINWSDSITVSGGTGATAEGSYGKYLAIRSMANDQFNETASHTRTISVQTKQALSVSVWGNGTVSQTDSTGMYFVGDDIHLTAKPLSGATFSGWYIDNELVSTDLSYIMEMYPYAGIVAKFDGGEIIEATSVDITLIKDNYYGIQPMMLLSEGLVSYQANGTESVFENTSGKMCATVYPVNATNKYVIWSSSDTSVATIDQNGMINFLDEGKVVISATLSNGVSNSMEITVEDNSITNLFIESEPDNKTYYEYEYLDLTGLKVMAKYADGNIVEVTDYEISGFDNISGKKTITVKYEGKIAVFTVDVIHHADWTVVREASCAQDGLSIKYCTICNETLETVNTPATKHDAQWVVTSPATPAQDGIKEFICNDCNTSLEQITYSYCDHEYTSVVKDPTCEEDGYTTKTCSKCGYVILDDITQALGHKYTSEVTQPDCNKEGYTVYTCSVCDHQYVSDQTPALGHDYTQQTIKATCTSYGCVRHTCSNCGDSYDTDTEEMLAHSYESVVTKATCDTAGYTTNTCLMCGFSYISDEVSALGHSFVDKTIDGGCTDVSYIEHVCSLCGYSYNSDKTEPEGHIESDWIVIKAATCTTDGEKHKVCEKCGDIISTEIISATNHANSHWVASDATCTDTGLRENKCTDCGYVISSEVFPALGHEYTSIVTKPTIEKEGYTTYTCTRCDHSYIDDYVDALGYEKDGFSYIKLDDGTIKIVGYSKTDSEIVIPKALNGCSVSGISQEVFSNISTPVDLIIKDYKLNVDELVLNENITIHCYKGSTAERHAINNNISYASYLKGDTNGDTVVSIMDATIIQQYLAELVDIDNMPVAVLDVNGSDELDILDANHVQRYLAGLTNDEWPAVMFTVTYDANGGTVSQKTEALTIGDKCSLPTPTRDFYTFEGWFTAPQDGVEITADTVITQATDFTLYAIWTENPVSDWVLASAIPEGAKVIDEKWKYTKTETTISTATSLDGWTQTGSSWKQTGSGTHYYASYPSGFNGSKNYSTSAISAYENTTTKRTVSSASTYKYIYWHWCRGKHFGSSVSNYNRKISHYYTSEFNTHHHFESTTNITYNASLDGYWYVNQGACDDTCWWNRFTVYRQTYTNYQKQFTYSRTTDMESKTEITSGNGISNIQKWVQYRAK